MLDYKKIYTGNLDWLVDRTMLATIHGSHAYGTNIETSDIDVKGICVAPKEYYYGFQKKFEQAEQGEPDMVIYEIRKFMTLAANCNPNIIEILFTDPSDWIHITEVGKFLYENRYLFLSTKARHTFSGYAISQLKRIKTHRDWLLNPPSEMPNRKDFGLPEEKKVSPSVMGAFDNLQERQKVTLDGQVMQLLEKEKQFNTAMQHYKQYMHWKKTRNEARAKLEEKHGFDCKHGMHLVRLMRMCREILEEGEVRVKRPDAQELVAIRNGEWTYDQLLEWAEKQDEELEVLYKNCTIIPKKVDHNKLNELCMQIVDEML